MTIASITPYPVRMQTDYADMTLFFVRVETTDGVVGWGESCDSFGISYPTVLARIVDDVWGPAATGRRFPEALDALDAKRRSVARTLGFSHSAAQSLSAVDIAIRDAQARSAGQSLSAALGRVSERLRVYAGNSHFLESRGAAGHIALLTPLLERGVSTVKMRIGPDWRTAMRVLSDLRTDLPAIDIMVDGSELFSVAESLEMAERLADLRVSWFEEPVPASRIPAISRIAVASRVPLAYGEHLFSTEHMLDTMDAAAISVVQPDASICGGIAEAQLMARTALGRGARVVMHLHGSPITIAANALVAAGTPGVDLIEYPFHLSPMLKRVAPEAGFDVASIEDGCISVPTGPGLGIEVDTDVIEAGRRAFLDS
ncbi:mandelate racemase/muconate lactonizing enzyme family protein [Microbacterium sp. LRZ72]|uniref:mandelate racemase/muconate lactonizing enzyme family protein n=1 Tax=Microbacterium sp. LRZ72 TaxID=2942481 RepID=UPI0029BDC146|nr:mandelate racemase/muconate lactonizing enzyme family protein [Microbacterium sp. LRZ72]MDX2376569.1 mandelate racemase/muconate lactonizing enzyme family protein [Microbacterium sp. LRZ72]